jgi:signal transduction histidine kinase
VTGFFADLFHRPASLPPLAGAMVQGALSLFLIIKQGELRVRLWFALLAACSALWAFAVAVTLSLDPDQADVGAGCARLSLAAIAIAGPMCLRFASALTRTQSRGLVLSSVVAAIAGTLIAAVPAVTVVRWRPGGGFWPTECLAFYLAAISSIPAVVYGLQLVFRTWRRTPPSRRRRQLGWAMIALAISAAGGFDCITIFVPIYPIGWATGALSCIVLFYAIAQHRLMAIRTFAVRTVLGVLGALLAAVAIYAVTAAGRSSALSPRLLALTAIILFVTTRGWISVAEPQLAKVLGRRRRSLEAAIADFERRSLEARDPDVVERQLAQAVKLGFGAELVDLLSADRDRDEEPILIDTAELALAELGTPVLRDLMDPNDRHAVELTAALDHLRADALVPLFSDGVLVAFAVLRGGALTPADDAVAADLVRLGERAARAVVNAKLYREVEVRGRGLEAQVKLRTAELEDALVGLKDAQAKLVEAERSSSLGLLVAGISHEINNALNFISANLPTLQRYAVACESVLERAPGKLAIDRLPDAREELPRSIARLGETTRRTGAIVGDLRKFARPDTERRMFRLDEGLDAALNLLRRRTDGRLDVGRVYVGAPIVECWPGQLNQAFFNILLNAVEAARAEIWVMVQEKWGGVEVIVSDDGEGIADEHLDQVFQPFFTTKSKAAGLGLTVARGVIERHGGRIHLTSHRGEDTVARVWLPIMPEKGAVA